MEAVSTTPLPLATPPRKEHQRSEHENLGVGLQGFTFGVDGASLVFGRFGLERTTPTVTCPSPQLTPDKPTQTPTPLPLRPHQSTGNDGNSKKTNRSRQSKVLFVFMSRSRLARFDHRDHPYQHLLNPRILQTIET